jgi:hypothetical protein
MASVDWDGNKQLEADMAMAQNMLKPPGYG